MKPISNQNYIPRGNLGARAGLLASRLEMREYRPETVLNMDQAGWPGDWEGRTILALVRMAETTKKEPAYLHEIVDIVLAARNERGYLGPIYDGTSDGGTNSGARVNEQQLSGHSWLLRGLCAYYGYTGRQDVYDAALTIGRNLFLPAKELYPEYPIRPEERVGGGDMSGHSAAVVGKWMISTDTGCAYIPLDGVSALYEMTRDPEIGALLDVMIENFLKIDFLGICVQTHATLTGTRGILRTYRRTGEARYLDAAKRLFAMYLEHGMTANYANYNWFGRPEWTEPCAIVDSFMCAMQLYAETGDRDCLTAAQRIYYNGIGFGQRENGGFGCDSCVGAVGVENNRIIRLHCPEAYWCCTMRGGEGLASVAEYAYLIDGDTVVVPYFSSSDARIPVGGGQLVLSQKSAYPIEGKTVFNVKENTAGNVTLACYLPDVSSYTAENITVSGASYSVDGGMLYLSVTAETREITVDFDVPYHAETPVGAHNEKDGVWAIFRGNVMYSVTADMPLDLPHEALIAGVDGYELRPLFDAYETDHAPRQVLFS
ncbi:MAG: glycoside hydrolase family 127 protein [Clostridia bacterium]|nr:glycoside hydrolase family 127 protein [Clostridia bacterium]